VDRILFANDYCENKCKDPEEERRTDCIRPEHVRGAIIDILGSADGR